MLALVALVGLIAFGTHALDALSFLNSNQERTSRWSLPYKTSQLFGAVLPGGRLDYRTPVRVVYALAFGVTALWLLLRTWRGADPVRMAAWATLALLVASAWLVPWYALWLLPLVALAPDRRLVACTVALCAWMLVDRGAALMELELIAAIERALREHGGRVLHGPGDDAAVVQAGGGVAVTSIDAVVEGVHFELTTHSPADVGHKALASALSDLAAMGARSGEAYVALGVPAGFGVERRARAGGGDGAPGRAHADHDRGRRRGRPLRSSSCR